MNEIINRIIIKIIIIYPINLLFNFNLRICFFQKFIYFKEANASAALNLSFI